MRQLEEVPEHLRPLVLSVLHGTPAPKITWPERVFRRRGPRRGITTDLIAVEADLPGGATRHLTGCLPVDSTPEAVEIAFTHLEATLTAALNGQELIALVRYYEPDPTETEPAP